MKNFISLFVFLFLFNYCSTNWGNFKIISLDAMNDKKENGQLVTGEKCNIFSWPSLEEAVKDATSKAQNSIGLKDVKIELKQSFFFGYRCFSVQGIPMK